MTDFEDHPIYAAIGRVVVEAASLEGALGILVSVLESGDASRVVPMMLGQACDRIRQLIVAQPAALAEEVERRLVAVEALVRRRNDVVHGWWILTDPFDVVRGRASRRGDVMRIEFPTVNELGQLAGETRAERVAILELVERV